jgi:hypothetical protein
MIYLELRVGVVHMVVEGECYLHHRGVDMGEDNPSTPKAMYA